MITFARQQRNLKLQSTKQSRTRRNNNLSILFQQRAQFQKAPEIFSFFYIFQKQSDAAQRRPCDNF